MQRIGIWRSLHVCPEDTQSFTIKLIFVKCRPTYLLRSTDDYYWLSEAERFRQISQKSEVKYQSPRIWTYHYCFYDLLKHLV